MNKLLSTIILLVVVFILSCDKNPATFEDSIPLHTLSTDVYPTDGGTVYPSEGDFNTGERIRIEAHPAKGYVFERWEKDIIGNSNPDLLVFRANSSVKAHFLKRNYDLNVNVSGEGLVRETVMKLSPGKDDSDTTSISVLKIRLEAEAENRWFFDRWEGDLNGSENPKTVSVENLKNITAVFDKKVVNEFTINIDTSGNGTVDLYPKRQVFKKGDQVILTAVADSGWNFKKWAGDLTGCENSQTVIIEKDIDATAHFGVRTDSYAEIVQQPTTTTAGNSVSPAPKIHLKNDRGNPVGSTKVKVSLNKNAFASGSNTAMMTNSDGVAEFNDLFIETASSGYILTFEAYDSTISDISSKPFKIISAEPDPSFGKVDVPSEGSVGESTDIIITLHDKFGNVVHGGINDLAVSVRGSNSATPDVKQRLGGAYIAKYTPVLLGKDQIFVSVNRSDIPGSPFTSNVGVGLPAEMEITRHPTTTSAGSALSPAPAIQVFGGYGNVIENVNVSVDLDGAAFAPGSTTSVNTNSNGVAQFNNLKIHSAASGYSLTFRTNDVNVTSEHFDIYTAPADPSASRAEIPNGVTGRESEIIIRFQDSYGNGISGAIDGISLKISGANNPSPRIRQNGSSGEYIARYIPSSAGADEVDIQYHGSSVGSSPYKKIVHPAAAHPLKSSITVSPDKISTVKVQPRDANGNPIGGLSSNDFAIDVTGNVKNGSIAETSALGIYTFDVYSDKLGEVIVSVSVSGIKLAYSPIIIFTVGDPHEAQIVTQPGNTQSGIPILGPPALQVYDEFGRVISGIDVHVREQNNYKFSDSDLIATTNQSGIAVFDNLTIHSANEWHTLVFSIKGIKDVISQRFLVIDESI